jgi:glycosyltransferase involved in cell wall biosynthesis
MRVIVFTSAYRPLIGGSEIAIEQIVSRLPEIFFEIVTPRYRKTLLKTESGINYKIHRVGFGCACDKYIFPLLGCLKALGINRKEKADILHAYQASYGAGAGWLFKKIYPRIKFIITLQEGKVLEEQGIIINWIRKIFLKNADFITAISTYLLNYAKLHNSSTGTMLIPNGVDIKKFTPPEVGFSNDSIRNAIGIKSGERVIISTSRLVSKNGLDILIKAFALAWQSDRSLRLLLIGGGPLHKQLRDLSFELGLGDAVLFLGEADYSGLPQYLRISEVFVRPSLSEGLGNSFLEAMASGVPVIGTQVGGIPDFLKDGETGLFCRSNDPEDLSIKILMILKDERLRAMLAENGINLIRSKYDWNLAAGRFAGLYTQLMQ